MRSARDDEPVIDARDRYLLENGLSTAEYTAPHFAVQVAGWTLRLPNPPRTLRAYRAGRRCRSLFVDTLSSEELLSLTVGELRRRIGLPPEGLRSAG